MKTHPTVQCILFTVHSTGPNNYTSHCMLHIANHKLSIVHSILYTAVQCSAQCELHNIHCKVNTDQSRLYSAMYTQSYSTCSLNMRSIGQDESTQTLFLLTVLSPEVNMVKETISTSIILAEKTTFFRAS